MVQRKPTAAVAVIVVLLLSAVVAAIALATTSQDAVAQQGCTGGGSSPSPSVSPSPSESEEDPIPSILPSLLPDPAPKKAEGKAADPAPLPAPDKDGSEAADAADQQQRSCRSTITLAYKSGRNPKFTGTVDSDEPMCKRARNVTIKKVKRGADPRVAKTTTNTKGKYTAPARKANGRFYAKVSKATTENRDGETVSCGAARSRAIKP